MPDWSFLQWFGWLTLWMGAAVVLCETPRMARRYMSKGE